MAKKYLIIAKSLVVLSLILVAFSATKLTWSAYSELYFQGPEENLIMGSEFEVKLLLSTDQPVNAYSINFSYPKEIVELIGFNDAGSIINIWQTQPQVSLGGDVSLKGGSTKAHNSGEGLITTINFKALTTGSGEIKFSNSNVYLANGKGTEVTPGLKNLALKVIEGSGGIPFKEPNAEDNLPPDIDGLSVIEDPLNTDQKLLSFIVKDDESGIEKVNYKTRRWFWWSKSQPALNPTAFSSDIWSINFEVVDNQGNASQQTLYDWSIFLKRVLPVSIIILGAFLLVINRIVRKKKL